MPAVSAMDNSRLTNAAQVRTVSSFLTFVTLGAAQALRCA
jgi:hypothetical protein